VDWSFYVTNIDPSQAETLGCNQGNYDTAHGNKNSEVTLEFGVQRSGGVGTLLTQINANVTNAQIETYAERFSYGYWHCTGSNTTSVLRLGIGTNTSVIGRSSSSIGQTWATVVNDVRSWNSTHGNPTTGACCVSSQVVTNGANDIETGSNWDTSLNVKQWAIGFDGATTAFYYDIGDAGGCPSTSWGGSTICNASWHQSDVWVVSWGQSAALSAPEIYNPTLAKQWHMISAYGVRIQLKAKISFEGPLDDNFTDPGSNTSQQAWDQLWTEINSTTDTGGPLKYSMQIHCSDTTTPCQ